MMLKIKPIKSILLVSLTGISLLSAVNMPGEYVGVYNVTDSSARISYLDNSSDEDGFKVYIYNNTDGNLDTTLSPNPIVVPKNDDGSAYQYTNLTNLQPDTFYQVKVTAFNASGESATTNPSSENGGRFRTVESCIPEMPGEYVGVWNITTSGARISFKDNSDNEDGFKAYVYNYDTDQLVNTVSLDAISGTGDYQYTTLTDLNMDTLYKVKVSAYNECGESQKTTPSSLTNGRFKTTPSSCPSMPSDYVGVYNVTDSSARISFIDNADNETGFKAYVYNLDTNELIDTVTVPSVEGVGSYQYANITGLSSDTMYKVRVSAFNSSCESPKTMPSSATNGRFKTTN